MSGFQKTIKYCAIAFAIFLIVYIFSMIAIGISSLSFVSHTINKFNENIETTEIKSNIDDTNITKIKIDLKATTLEIRRGDKLKVETNNSKIKVTTNDNELEIKEEKSTSIGINKNDKTFKLILPEDIVLEELEINIDAGNIKIINIETNTFDLDLDAGKADINKLIVEKETEIDTGAGNIFIKNSNLNNLNLELGTGNSVINANITGNSKIESGVGNTTLNLSNELDDYKLKLTKGIGKITLDNETIKNNTTIGNGNNYIEITGGVGNIEIYTKK